MKETNGSFLSPAQKRAAVERGEAVFYPWAGNPKSQALNASDIMLGSSVGWTCELDLAPGWQEQSDLVHKAWIRPTKVPSAEPVTSEIIHIPEPASNG